MQRTLTRADILDMAAYEAVRAERRAAVMSAKANRRVEVGPHATFYFENRDTMWLQIHEMLRIEKGGEAQIEDELSAYNSLIPQGRELVATLMFEIDDPVLRDRVLRSLTGVEETVVVDIGGDVVKAVAEREVERTKADGKTSSIHFLHFPFSEDQIRRFRDPSVRVMVGVQHDNYAHMAVLGQAVREALAADFA